MDFRFEYEGGRMGPWRLEAFGLRRGPGSLADPKALYRFASKVARRSRRYGNDLVAVHFRLESGRECRCVVDDDVG